MQAPMRGIAAPRERKRDRAFAFLEVGARERAAHGGSDGIGSDVAVGREVARQHRQVLQRQLVGIGDQDGVAADLNRKLRGADDGRANALARVPDRSKVAPMRQQMAQLLGEVGAEIAEAPSFPLIEIFRDPAGKGDGIDAPVGELGRPGFGHEQRPCKLARLAQIDQSHDHASHARGDALAVARRERRTERELDAESLGNLLGRRFDAREAAAVAFDDQPAAHRNGARSQDAAVLDQREFGRAAADVDIEQCRVVTARERDGARSMGCHLAFHVVAGRGADEFAGFLGEEIRDGACVAALERLAGQNDGAAVDLLAFDAGIGVAAADETGEIVEVDGVVGPVGRQQDRRLPEDFSLDDDEATRQRRREPLQVHAREHQMRGRRPDIDSDRRQLDVVGGPGDLVDRDIVGADMKMLEFEIVHRQTMILARVLGLKSLSELAAAMAGPSNPPHYAGALA